MRKIFLISCILLGMYNFKLQGNSFTIRKIANYTPFVLKTPKLDCDGCKSYIIHANTSVEDDNLIEVCTFHSTNIQVIGLGRYYYGQDSKGNNIIKDKITGEKIKSEWCNLDDWPVLKTLINSKYTTFYQAVLSTKIKLEDSYIKVNVPGVLDRLADRDIIAPDSPSSRNNSKYNINLESSGTAYLTTCGNQTLTVTINNFGDSSTYPMNVAHSYCSTDSITLGIFFVLGGSTGSGRMCWAVASIPISGKMPYRFMGSGDGVYINVGDYKSNGTLLGLEITRKTNHSLWDGTQKIDLIPASA